MKERVDKEALPKIVDLLDSDPDKWTRVIATYVLGEIGSNEITPALEKAKNDSDMLVREMAFEKIKHLRLN